jgi:hypothetical protein
VSASSTAAERLRRGWVVIAALALLSLIEYFVATGLDHALLWLVPLTLAKAWLILDQFMHVKAVFTPGEEH